MIVLITGARGAIGRHVAAEAKRRGARVIGLGHGAWSGDPDLPAIDRWVNGDVTSDNLDTLAELSVPPDLIVHLAGGSHVGASIDHPAEDFRRTVVGAQQLVEWMRTRSPAARLVVASSAAVYGNAAASPIPEGSPFAPTSPYGTHKAMVEMLAVAYARQYGINAAIVRLFSVYGPGLRKQVVFELFQRLLKGERLLQLGGTGRESRDFVFVSDAARLLLDAGALANQEVPVFNGSTGVSVTVDQLARAMAELFADVQITFSGEVRKGDPSSLVGDQTRAQAAGLITETSLDAGLRQTFEWISAQPEFCR